MQLSTKTKNIIAAIVTIAIGVFLIIKKDEMLNIIFTITGALLIILGILDVLDKANLIMGVIKIGVGILLIVGGWVFIEIIEIIFGVLLILWAAQKFINTKNKTIADWAVIALAVVLGVMIIVGSVSAFSWIFIVLGILIILYGIGMLFGKQPVKRKSGI